MSSRASKRQGTDKVRAFLVSPCLGLLCLGAGRIGTSGDPDDRIEQARATLEKWVETRRILSQERRDWALGRETLQERIGLVQRELESLQRKLTEAQQSITEADKKRAELQAENEHLTQGALALSGTVAAQESRTQELLRRLPDPIKERVKPLSQRLPEDPALTMLSLGERFQNLVGILNEVNKFNREIMTTSEVRLLPDGSSAEVTALYVGLGQGYYASANGKAAGVGTSAADGWAWKPANEAAPEILAAIAILKNERAAAFVRLPLEVH